MAQPGPGSTDVVHVDVTDGLATVELHRPGASNALDVPLKVV